MKKSLSFILYSSREYDLSALLNQASRATASASSGRTLYREKVTSALILSYVSIVAISALGRLKSLLACGCMRAADPGWYRVYWRSLVGSMCRNHNELCADNQIHLLVPKTMDMHLVLLHIGYLVGEGCVVVVLNGDQLVDLRSDDENFSRTCHYCLLII